MANLAFCTNSIVNDKIFFTFFFSLFLLKKKERKEESNKEEKRERKLYQKVKILMSFTIIFLFRLYYDLVHRLYENSQNHNPIHQFQSADKLAFP